MQLSSEQHNGCTVGFFDYHDDGSDGQADTATRSWSEHLLRGPVPGTVGNCRDPRRTQAFAKCHAYAGVDYAPHRVGAVDDVLRRKFQQQ